MILCSYNPGERVTLLAGHYEGCSGTVAMIVYDWQPNVDLVYIKLDHHDPDGVPVVVRRISDEVARETTVLAHKDEL